MSSTIKLSATTAWAQSYCQLRPLTGQGDVAGEPALTNANGVLQFILAPPFAWPWNRKTYTFTTVSGTQDYVQAASDFGWAERASVNDGTTIYTCDARLVLPDSTDPGRPNQVAAQIDDGAGNITFRCYPVPDAVYTVKVIAQKKAPIIASVNGTWAPVPDDRAYLYNSGFLAAAFENIDDARFQVEYNKFLRSVIAANGGLDETQVNAFLAEKLITMRQMQGSSLDAQMSRQMRG